jgi:hypothetical protein
MNATVSNSGGFHLVSDSSMASTGILKFSNGTEGNILYKLVSKYHQPSFFYQFIETIPINQFLINRSGSNQGLSPLLMNGNSL